MDCVTGLVAAGGAMGVDDDDPVLSAVGFDGLVALSSSDVAGAADAFQARATNISKLAFFTYLGGQIGMS